MKVSVCADFEKDNRYSMDEYASRLFEEIKLGYLDDIQFYRPEFPAYLKGQMFKTWKLRWARYISYPLQARQLEFDINHIIDHAYAHLVSRLKPAKTIVTVHDLIPYLTWKNKIAGLEQSRHKPWLNIYSLSKLKYADAIITDCMNTRSDLISELNLEQMRIHVIPLGIDERFSQSEKSDRDTFKAKMGWHDGDGIRRILITGAASYKNWITSLRILKNLRKDEQVPFKVEMIKSGKFSQDIEDKASEMGLGEAFTSVSVSKEDMPNLYSSVDCLCFPSLYEGYGFPPLEALSCGLPVVCSNTPAIMDSLDGIAPLHNPLNVQGFANSIKRILLESDYRSSLIATGQKHVSKLTWKETARMTVDVYNEVLKN